MNEFLRTITYALTHQRMPTAPESLLQDRIASCLTAVSVPFEREVVLTAKDRIDFLIGGELGLEVKVDGSLSDVTRQLHRYAQCERVTHLLLVSTRMRLRSIPCELNGKRVDFLHLTGAAF